MPAPTAEEWMIIARLSDLYYKEHGKLIERIIDQLPEDSRSDLQPYLVEQLSERSSVYGRPDK